MYATTIQGPCTSTTNRDDGAAWLRAQLASRCEEARAQLDRLVAAHVQGSDAEIGSAFRALAAELDALARFSSEPALARICAYARAPLGDLEVRLDDTEALCIAAAGVASCLGIIAEMWG